MITLANGDDVGAAATEFMRRYENASGHYDVGIYDEERDVYVRLLGDTKVFVVRVAVQALPSYRVCGEPKLLDEHYYKAPFYVHFTGLGGSECRFKYDTIEAAQRGAAYIGDAGGHMITITDNDDQFVHF